MITKKQETFVKNDEVTLNYAGGLLYPQYTDCKIIVDFKRAYSWGVYSCSIYRNDSLVYQRDILEVLLERVELKATTNFSKIRELCERLI